MRLDVKSEIEDYGMVEMVFEKSVKNGRNYYELISFGIENDIQVSPEEVDLEVLYAVMLAVPYEVLDERL
ncbi:MAG: hypothetical protein A2504_09920 [Bdellovibrionales bacterium RIFOXYD12_FULL_39_22]|nr:MAG: hypothetical protein A2385_17555 [Bdellovibrionales bacterium RIFOXYB1_FULL_39_21]OFZ43927.1 MAG: hypothetical protein A2485_04225 [Bdellovibrionales bacterium RIFOXYC12_FULL_39_17]OFZ48299.1 MAG: hypothetical protein A2404_01640 [Bdellovibrionales bacterium RIFOXYC1_FULL_39_130]OFZ94890.1 MAG: hypothetical protein A2504_09920 [Bdellovibrionales bacterium RIFOXYD12_FULL_39_22]HLE12689.1 hypothetical protein [Bacteriovoracaceae bacterium]